MLSAIKVFVLSRFAGSSELSEALLHELGSNLADASSAERIESRADSRAQNDLRRNAELLATQPDLLSTTPFSALFSREVTNADMSSARQSLLMLRVAQGMEKMSFLNFREYAHNFFLSNMHLMNHPKFFEYFQDYDHKIVFRMNAHQEFLEKIEGSIGLHNDAGKVHVVINAFNEMRDKIIFEGSSISEVFYLDAVKKALSIVKNFPHEPSKIEVLNFLMNQHFPKAFSQAGQQKIFECFVRFVVCLHVSVQNETFQDLIRNLAIHGKFEPKELKNFLKSQHNVIKNLSDEYGDAKTIKQTAKIFNEAQLQQSKEPGQESLWRS